LSDDTLSDEELVARCQAELPGTTRSFEVLVQRYKNRVYRLVYHVVANKEEAEDISQDIFLKVYRSLPALDQPGSFARWLYRVAMNSALDALDKSQRRSRVIASLERPPASPGKQETDPLERQAMSAPGPEEQVIQEELRECIKRVLRQLEKNQVRVLMMRDVEDLPYEDIAESLGVGLSATKMRIHRARLAFQKLFMESCGRFTGFTSVLAERKAAGKRQEQEGAKS
jgi:RNA polymerase sigma-70 factor (ECF subfamily)